MPNYSLYFICQESTSAYNGANDLLFEESIIWSNMHLYALITLVICFVTNQNMLRYHICNGFVVG